MDIVIKEINPETQMFIFYVMDITGRPIKCELVKSDNLDSVVKVTKGEFNIENIITVNHTTYLNQ
jgi:hypothetical protein